MRFAALALLVAACATEPDRIEATAPEPDSTGDAGPTSEAQLDDAVDATGPQSQSESAIGEGRVEQREEGDHHWYPPIIPWPWRWPWGHHDSDNNRQRWRCDVSCNVQPSKKGARCPQRVTGVGSGPSSDAACNAAKVDANSKVPRDCYKRHCDCRCAKE